ncbi:MAG: hypothetical protein KY476_12995 [Planctomycetes bacterium]|nr:hypothetical protein [Planctomycetota bacterium]
MPPREPGQDVPVFDRRSASQSAGTAAAKDEFFQSGQEHESRAGFMGRCTERFEHRVEGHPVSSILTGFAAGLGLGLAIGWLLGEPPKQSRWYGAETAERLGRKVLDAMSGIVPERLKTS